MLRVPAGTLCQSWLFRMCCLMGAIKESTITLALLLFLSRRTPGGLFVWDKSLLRAWKGILPLPMESEATMNLPSWTQRDHDQESRGQSQEAVLDKEEGTTVWQQEPQCCQSPWKGSGHTATTIRKLLCDNATCVLCECAAREAEKVVHIQRLSPENLVLRKPSLPTTSYVERSSLPSISALQDNPIFSRSRSEPPPSFGHLRHSLGASPLLRKWERPPRNEAQRKRPLLSTLPGTEVFPKRIRHPRHPHSQVASEGKDHFYTVNEQKVKEDESSTSSSMSDLPCRNRAENGHSSGVSKGRQKNHTLRGHQKTFHHHEDQDERSSSSEMEASPNSQGEDQRGTHFVSEPEQDFPISSLTCSSRKMVFVPTDIPFVSEAVLEKLEQHLVVKRIQNTMGLPVVLLRSFKAFLPFAPSSNIQWPMKREAVVVTRPQVLPFKNVAIRRRLEQHVKKRVHLKYWGLPRHLQEVVRHMKMDFHPTVPWEGGSGRGEPQGAVKPHLLIPRFASTARDAAFNSPLPFRARFQVHIGKKFFQIAQETFPKRVENSQKTTALEEEKIVLPKLIRLHRRYPQLRCGPSLGLRRKADCVEMNIKYKHIQFLWDLPTWYSQSLSKVSLEAFNLPVAPPRGFPTSEFAHAETPFLPVAQRQRLDAHVLQRRVQHQWGQPGLVQQSLWRFLSAAPPAATSNPATTKCHRVDIKVAPPSTLPWIPSETHRKLDDHLRRKAVERRWGIPQRVMNSLQTFMPMAPPAAETARERVEEKVQKMPPFVKEPSLCKFPQALQGDVAKKALQMHLGPAGPFPALCQTAALQEREGALPRIISPELRALQLRPKELHFVELTALERIELSIRHKDLAHRWGLPARYERSLSYLFTGVEFKCHPPPLSRKGIKLDFSSSDTLFLSQGARKDLEWHVRRKTIQHAWGLAGLAQKSLQSLMPDAPHWHTAGHMEVATLPAQITFLGDASMRELERNVLKRVVLQRWHLPRRALEPVKLLGSEMAAVSGPRPEMRKPRRTAVSSPHRPEVFCLPQRKAPKEMEFHLDKKHMEILLGVVPALVRFSWRHAFFTQRQPLPKPIPPGRSFLQPRCHLLPFERPEDLAQIEQALRHRSLMFLWGLSTQFLEALGGMMPKPSLHPLRPRGADRSVFSEAKTLFLQERDWGDFEGHIRRKRLQHQWGLPDVVQKSLRGFMGGAPSQRSHQNTVIHVQVLHQVLSFLPWDSGRSLELHMQRWKQQRRWGLPRRVWEALRVLGAESIASPPAEPMEGVDQGQSGLGPSGLQAEAVAAKGEEGPASQPASPGATSPLEALYFRSKAEKEIQLLFLKRCVEVHMGIFPGVARQSWQHLPPARAPLLKLISPGSRVPQPRSHFLPFARDEDISRLELAILRHHLASLWGLGRVYVEGIAALRPKLPSSQRRPREGKAERSEDQAISLPAQVREALELHIRKKRLGHEWGFPGLIRKSLCSFMQRAPPLPSLPKAEKYARILCQSPAFLTPSTCTHLESHLQRRQLQQRWRLPAKALQSFKLLCPRLESGLSDPRSNGDEEVPLCCLGHGAVSDHPTADLVSLEPGGDVETADSRGATPQWAQALSTVDPKDMDHIQILLTKKIVEVRLGAIRNIAGLAWTKSSSRQHLPKLIPPGLRIQQRRTSFLPFFRAGETEQIEMAIRCNHLASLWGLGARYVDVLSARRPNPFSERFRLRRTGMEFSGAQTLFLQEQERQDLESHVAKKKIQHTWGSPALVQKSAKAFMQGLSIAPTPQRTMVCVHIIHQAPPFLPQDISSRLEFHVQKMNFQRQWGLPRRVLKPLWLLCPAGEDADVQRPTTPMSHLDQTWRNVPRDPSSETAPGGWPAGAQSTEQDRRKKSEVMSALEPQSLKRLRLHLAKKYMEVQHGVLPTIAKASLQSADLYSKQPLSKLIRSGHGLLRPHNISLLTVSTEDRDHLEWTVQRNDFDFLWGLGPRYKEPLAGMMPECPCPFPRHRQAKKDFLEMQTFFLQKKDREALEGHVKKKRIQHIWSCPILVQRSMECFMPRAPLSSSSRKAETNTRIMLHELHFLPPNAQTHLEHHIQKRKLLQRWGLPKQMLGSLKTFLPTASEMQAPVSPTEEFWEGPKSQEWKQMTFSLKQKSALQSRLERKHLEMRLGVDPRLVKQSRDKAHGLEREHLPILIHPGQKGPTDRTQSLLYLPPHTLNRLELNVRHKDLAFLWGLPSQYLESLSRMTSTVPMSNPPKQQLFRFQGVETPYLQGKEKEALEHHVKKKRLQHQWGLPAAVQRSLQAFAPSLLVPIHPPQRVGQGMKIQVQRPLFLLPHSQEDLEDSLKRMIIHQQWGLPKKIHDSLRAFFPALPVRTQQPCQEKAGPDLTCCFAKTSSLKNHLRRKSTEIALQSRTAPNVLLTESLCSRGPARSTAQPPAATSAIDGKGPNPGMSQDEAIGLLEFHILHKKICHEWGLPLIVQKSLSAFCPPLSMPQADRGTVGKNLETAKEDGATAGENVFPGDEVTLLGADQQVTEERVSESPQDSERDSVSTKATEVGKLNATGGVPQASKEASSTGGKLQDSKEESREPLQGTEDGRLASQTLQPLTKTRTDPESPQARARSSSSPQGPQAPEEARCERPETTEGDSPETSERTTVPSKSLQAAEGANVARLQAAALVAGETPEGSSGTRHGSMASETPQAAEERSALGSTPRGAAAAEGERRPPAPDALWTAGEGTLGVAEEGAATDHSLQVGPGNVASQSPRARGEVGVAAPPATKVLSLGIGSPQAAEGTAAPGKSSQATEGSAGLQAAEEVAVETPQALEEMVGASRLPQDEEYGSVISPRSETLQSVALEIPLAVEEGSAVAGTPVTTEKAKTAAVTAPAEERALPRECHAEEPPSIEDTGTASGRRPPTAEKRVVVSKHQAEEETNVPDQAPPALEGGMGPHVPLGVSPSGSLIPEAADEAKVPEKGTWAKGEARAVVGDSQALGPGGSPETSWVGHRAQAREEKRSVILGEIANGSCPEEQQEERSASGQSSGVASEEGFPSRGLSCPEEGNAEGGALLAGAEGGLPEQQQQQPRVAAATGRPPEEGGVPDVGGSCQVTAGWSTLAEGPRDAERKGTSLVQGGMDHLAAPRGGQAPEGAQGSFRTFLPHLEPRFHSCYEPAGGHFCAETEPRSRSSPPKKPRVYRAELCLRLEPGGRLSSWVSAEKPPCSFSPEALPDSEASEGGSSQEAELGTRRAGRAGPQGRASHQERELKPGPRVPLQWDTPKQGPCPLCDPEAYGGRSLHLPQSRYYEDDASHRDSWASDSSELSSLESNAESMPSSAIEQLPWDKGRFSRQLERRIRAMVRHSALPSGLRRSGRKRVTYSPWQCGTTVCERDVDQRWELQGEAFSVAHDAGTRSTVSPGDRGTRKKVRCAGSITQGCLAGQENLLRPSEAAANSRLRTHVTQRALASFILPACVISSYSSCEDVEVGLIRQAGREHRQKLSARSLEEKPVLEEERESPPEQGHGVAVDAGRPPMSAALYAGEPKDWAGGHLCEPSPPPPSLNVSGSSLEQQDREGSQGTEDTGEASGAGSGASNVSSKKLSTVSSLEADSELPAPPSDWLRSGTGDEGAEGEREDGSGLVIGDVPETERHRPTQQHSTSLEDQALFSTECEWERVGDWDSEGIEGWDSESLAKGEEEESSDLDLEERPPAGSSPKAEASSQAQAERASSSSGMDKSKGLCLVGSIVERKLSLKQGLNIWQRSQGRRLTTWTEKNGRGAPGGEEEARGGAEGRAGFSGDAQSALEGDVAGRRRVDPRSAVQSGEEACGRGGTHGPLTQTLLTGFHNGSDTSTSSTSTHSQAERSSAEHYFQARTVGTEEAERAWDRPGSKTSALTSVARRRRTPQSRSPESPAEGGPGSRPGGSSQRIARPGGGDGDSSSREESSSSSREERPGGGTPGRGGRPTTLRQGAARISGWRSGRRRKDSLLHGRSGDPRLPRAQQEDGAGKPAAGRSPRSRGGSSERDVLRRRLQECRAAGMEGSPPEESRGPLGGCGAPETRAPLGGPGCPLPEGEQFCSLREKILLRRKELWSSPDSEENPV